MLRVAIGTYEGHLYGWELRNDTLKMSFGYAAHGEKIEKVEKVAESKNKEEKKQQK